MDKTQITSKSTDWISQRRGQTVFVNDIQAILCGTHWFRVHAVEIHEVVRGRLFVDGGGQQVPALWIEIENGSRKSPCSILVSICDAQLTVGHTAHDRNAAEYMTTHSVNAKIYQIDDHGQRVLLRLLFHRIQC